MENLPTSSRTKQRNRKHRRDGGDSTGDDNGPWAGFAVCSFDGGTDRNCSVREKCVGTAKPGEHHKIMTLLLIFEELEKGTLQLTDEVTTSAHARSMGGSQVFLEEGEKQTVETMIKCIVVASGNDASVAMAEHIAGTESEFRQPDEPESKKNSA